MLINAKKAEYIYIITRFRYFLFGKKLSIKKLFVTLQPKSVKTLVYLDN